MIYHIVMQSKAPCYIATPNITFISHDNCYLKQERHTHTHILLCSCTEHTHTAVKEIGSAGRAVHVHHVQYSRHTGLLIEKMLRGQKAEAFPSPSLPHSHHFFSFFFTPFLALLLFSSHCRKSFSCICILLVKAIIMYMDNVMHTKGHHFLNQFFLFSKHPQKNSSPKKLYYCHYLFTLMSVQTCVTFFTLFNTKEYSLNNIVCPYTIKVNEVQNNNGPH